MSVERKRIPLAHYIEAFLMGSAAHDIQVEDRKVAMSGLLGLLIAIIVIAIVVYLLMWVVNQIAMPQPIRVIIVALIALLLLVFIINRFGLLSGL